MAGAIELKAPNGVDKFRLEKTSNTSKTIDADTLQDTAGIQAMIDGRSGSDGAFSFRNKIVDGRFDFWYEGTTQTTSGYGSDTMWSNASAGSTKVHSQQPLVAGVDLPAIECPSAKYFSRTVVTSVADATNYVSKFQRIEDVSTLAGKTVTLSFYAKADSTRNIAVNISQIFGTNGSPDVHTPFVLVQLNTNWKRYTVSIDIPSISGKTIGTNTRVNPNFWFDVGPNTSYYLSAGGSSPGQQSGTFDIACVQLEEGTVATPFEELPIEVSQKRLERYFETTLPHPFTLTSAGALSIRQIVSGVNTLYGANLRFNTIKRTTPTVTFYPADISLVAGSITSVVVGAITATPTGTNERGVTLIVLGTASSSAGQSYWVHYVADARL